MKIETKVYLPVEMAKALDQLATRTRRPKSEIVRAAMASFLSPDGAERTEAAMIRRLDRMARRMERMAHETQLGNEALHVFVRAWFEATPRVAAEDRPAVRALADARYAQFLDLVMRRMESGHGLAGAVEERRAEGLAAELKSTPATEAPGDPAADL